MCAHLLNAYDGHRVAPERHDHPPAVNQRDRVLPLALPLERVKAQRRNLVQVVEDLAAFSTLTRSMYLRAILSPHSRAAAADST